MKTIRIGIYGLWRGASFLPILSGFDGVEVTALCEKNEDKLKAIIPYAANRRVKILKKKLKRH